MSPTETLRNFTVGAIEVSPQHNTLRLVNRSITVQPKVMAVLYYLAQHQTRVVGNEELLQAVWQGRVVTLASVQKSINALRSALADLAGEQEFVAYFSKRGYQLMQPVSWVEVSSRSQNESAPLVPAAPPEPPSNAAEADVTSSSNTHPNSSPTTVALPLNEPPPKISAPKTAALPLKIIMGMVLIGVIILAAFYWLYTPKSAAPNTATQRPAPVAPAPTDTAETAGKKLPWQIITHYLPAEANAHHTTPSPDSKRAAYLRDTEIAGGAHQSDLMIRDTTGTDWLLARSNSAWVDLAWSPSGRALAALEIYRADGLLKDPDFYQSPQYLYNIHLFTLDLKGQHLLEKNLLSQWQGKVNSITWWDENTLEFVATMGANLTKERYRYSITDQTLTSLAPLPTGFQPLISRVRDKTTALISRLQDKTQVEFLDEQQNLLGKQLIAASIKDLSWAADGGGVYGLETQQNSIYFLPIQGSGYSAPLPAPLHNMPPGGLGNLKINGDGKSIFVSTSSQDVQLYQHNPQGLSLLADVHNLIHSSVVYSPAGDGVIYATHQNNQAQIWLLKNGNTEALYKTDGPIQTILWPGADYLLVKANNKIARYQLDKHSWSVLLEDAQDLTPLAYQADTQALIAVKNINDVRNIWRINLETHQYKQLTF
ncbi:MAG TPA: winged helix-turn-helix domain-containing protein, partial [Cellvibrionaceae bacterium]|nr:winged helix-turn-helix domain-containing protein [Cellvibrionaceae bacterium]